jgi:hypothetical protein
VYERHQCVKPRKRVAGSNLVDMGRNAARGTPPCGGVSTPKPGCDAGGEATVKVCGVAVGEAAGVELDAKLIDRFQVNAGTVPGRSGTSVIRTGVPDRNVAVRRRRDGAEAS